MTAVVLPGPGGPFAMSLPTAPPALSPELSALANAVAERRARGGSEMLPGEVPTFLEIEARELEAPYGRAMEQATVSALAEWLQQLLLSRCATNPPASKMEVVENVSVLWAAVCGYPLGVWTRDALLDWMRESTFWPLPATLARFAEGQAAHLRSQRWKITQVLRAAAARALMVDMGPSPNAVQRERVAAVVDERANQGRLSDEVLSRLPVPTLPPAAPVRALPPISDERLLAVLSRELLALPLSQRAAHETRIGMLRKKIAQASAARGPDDA